MSVEIDYREQSLDNVIAYWVKDYEVEKGDKIIKSEWFVDVHQNKIIFRLFVDKADKKES